jgi:hypothetical protein
MISLRRELLCLGAAIFYSFLLPVQPANGAAAPASVESPIAIFRELLGMSPQERSQAIAIRPVDVQKRILEKLNEYEILPNGLREQRLRETELRWYLRPLMDEPRTNRAARLALIPEDFRKLVEERLQLWDLLPPPLQQEWENNDLVAGYFAQVGSAAFDTNEISGIPPDELNRWKVMSPEERQKALAGFNKFFELPPEEKEKTLESVSDEERQQMKQTLDAFGKLTPAQRVQCIRSFEKFATMSLAERQQFLKNAEEWSKMTPEEREKWRQLVTVAPIMPMRANSHAPVWPTSFHRLGAPAVATNSR